MPNACDAMKRAVHNSECGSEHNVSICSFLYSCATTAENLFGTIAAREKKEIGSSLTHQVEKARTKAKQHKKNCRCTFFCGMFMFKCVSQIRGNEFVSIAQNTEPIKNFQAICWYFSELFLVNISLSEYLSLSIPIAWVFGTRISERHSHLYGMWSADTRHSRMQCIEKQHNYMNATSTHMQVLRLVLKWPPLLACSLHLLLSPHIRSNTYFNVDKCTQMTNINC